MHLGWWDPTFTVEKNGEQSWILHTDVMAAVEGPRFLGAPRLQIITSYHDDL